jgi:polyisoprenoid-binding protein YceI
MKIFSYAFMIGLLITPLLASAQKAIQVDTGESRINWIAKKPTGEHRGYLKLSGGELLVDSNQIKGGSFIIDMKSVTDVDISDNTTNDKITRDLKSSKIFDINKYPTSKFVITSIRKLNNSDKEERKSTHKVEGELTIKGVTHKISFDASINLLNGKFTASTPAFPIDRTEWGLNYQSKSASKDTKDEYLYDDVAMQVEVVSE